MRTRRNDKPKRLKPAGHSAWIESVIQPAIVIGSTLMSAIAAYVLASDEIAAVLGNRGTLQDAFVIALCAGMGLLIDTAIIVSATRYKMHKLRDDPREDGWLRLSQWVLGIGMVSESMTTFYFFTQLNPSAFPWWLLWAANWIHTILSVGRAGLIPITIAYFAAGILPVTYDRSDLNREILARTSSNIALIVDKLSIVWETEDKPELLRALAGQLMLNTYAKYDDTQTTTEDRQLQRDGKLIQHFGRIHRLDWTGITVDVAPELAGAMALPAPAIAGPEAKRKEEEQPAPAHAPVPETPPARPAPVRQPIPLRQPATEPEPAPPLAPAAQQARRQSRSQPRTQPRTQPSVRRRGLGSGLNGLPRSEAAGAEVMEEPEGPEGLEPPSRKTLRQRREEAAQRILADDPDITNTDLARKIAIATKTTTAPSTARAIRDKVENVEGEPADQRQPLRFLPALPLADEAQESDDDGEGSEQRRN